MASAVTGVVLAGGASMRMGRDKAHLPWGDRTVIEHVIETLRSVTDDVMVVVKDRRRFQHLDVTVVEDLVPGAHALGGLYTGLALATHERCFVCACDAPFLNPRLIRFLIEHAEGWDLVIPRTREGLQPLHAVYGKPIVPAIEEQLGRRAWDLRALVPHVRACIIEPAQLARFDPDGRSFFNVNTPHEYAAAKAIRAERSAGRGGRPAAARRIWSGLTQIIDAEQGPAYSKRLSGSVCETTNQKEMHADS